MPPVKPQTPPDAIQAYLQAGGRIQRCPPARADARPVHKLGELAEEWAALGLKPNVITRGRR